MLNRRARVKRRVPPNSDCPEIALARAPQIAELRRSSFIDHRPIRPVEVSDASMFTDAPDILLAASPHGTPASVAVRDPFGTVEVAVGAPDVRRTGTPQVTRVTAIARYLDFFPGAPNQVPHTT